jgi:hypothetical protein
MPPIHLANFRFVTRLLGRFARVWILTQAFNWPRAAHFPYRTRVLGDSCRPRHSLVDRFSRRLPAVKKGTADLPSREKRENLANLA